MFLQLLCLFWKREHYPDSGHDIINTEFLPLCNKRLSTLGDLPVLTASGNLDIISKSSKYMYTHSFYTKQIKKGIKKGICLEKLASGWLMT